MVEDQSMPGELFDMRRFGAVFVEQFQIVRRVVFGDQPDKVGFVGRHGCIHHGGSNRYQDRDMFCHVVSSPWGAANRSG